MFPAFRHERCFKMRENQQRRVLNIFVSLTNVIVPSTTRRAKYNNTKVKGYHRRITF